jgi:hypothetical protein
MARSKEAIKRRAAIRLKNKIAIVNRDYNNGSPILLDAPQNLEEICIKLHAASKNALPDDVPCVQQDIQLDIPNTAEAFSQKNPEKSASNNWLCKFCSNSNFLFRKECNRCCRNRVLCEKHSQHPPKSRHEIDDGTKNTPDNPSVVETTLNNNAQLVCNENFIHKVIAQVKSEEEKKAAILVLQKKNAVGWTAVPNSSTLEKNQLLRNKLSQELATGIMSDMSPEERIRAAILMERSLRKSKKR